MLLMSTKKTQLSWTLDQIRTAFLHENLYIQTNEAKLK